MSAAVAEETTFVVTVKVPVVAAAATVTLAGTVAAAVLELVSVTTTPPVGAGPVSVTVPVEGFGPTTDTGLNASEESAGGSTVRGAAFVTPEYVAEMLNVAEVVRVFVVIVNVAEVAPAATVTLDGTVAAEVFALVRLTDTVEVAGTVSVTVPVTGLPPATADEDSVNEASAAGGVTVNVAVCVTPPREAEIVTGVAAETESAVTVNVLDIAPAETKTLAGTVAAPVLELVRATDSPPVGAGPFKVTVPVAVPPPGTLVGLTVREAGVGG